MKLKPLPKALLVLAVAGGVAYGGSVWFEGRDKQPTQTVDQAAQQPQPPLQQPAAQPQAQPTQVQQGATAAPFKSSEDRGLDALMGAGK